MLEKAEIVRDWLPRYTGRGLDALVERRDSGESVKHMRFE
jgi:hypothetical protein